jgi:hypothetical protein
MRPHPWFVIALLSAAAGAVYVFLTKPMLVPGLSGTGTASIRGIVVDTDGRLLADVTIEGGDDAQRVRRAGSTDQNGRFTLPALPAGVYQVFATKPGYLPTYFGERHPGVGWVVTAEMLRVGPTLIPLAAGQEVDSTSICRLASCRRPESKASWSMRAGGRRRAPASTWPTQARRSRTAGGTRRPRARRGVSRSTTSRTLSSKSAAAKMPRASPSF